MNKIELKQVLPNVFRSRNDIVSEVWHKEIEFCKGEKCLIEANSGTGKSSLCSFVYGFRNDYIGNILFDGEDISVYKNNAVIYTVNLCRIPSYFEKLERAFHPMEWEEF